MIGLIENLARLSREKLAYLAEQNPPSFAQERLWFLHQLDPHNVSYNNTAAWRLTGKLDVRSLERALNEIIRRHETLRTIFPAIDGQLLQIVLPSGKRSLPIVDLSQLESDRREAEARRLLAAEARQPFDLEREAMRAILIRLREDQHLAVMSMHHIISDYLSMAVFFAELTSFYRSFIDQIPASLPELPIQYVDFSRQQRQWMQSHDYERQLAYWVSKLEGCAPELNLLTDRPRPAIHTHRGARRAVIFSETLSDSLRRLSRAEGCTLFMTLAAAFKVLLHRYSGQTDILVGLPISGRVRSELEGQIGLFVNTLVLRSDLSANPAFRKFLQTVREGVLDAYANQDFPFEKLVEALRLDRNASRTPLFQVMFVVKSAPPQRFELCGLEAQREDVEALSSKFDLTLALEDALNLRGEIEYNQDLFDDVSIARMMESFIVLLEGICASPDCPLMFLPLLTESEKLRLLELGNDSGSGPSLHQYRYRYFHEPVELQAQSTPDVIAAICGQAHLSYHMLGLRANQLADRLRKLGAGPETIVGLCVERSLEMLIGLLGVLKAGGAYLPIDPAVPKDRLAWMIEETGAPIILTRASFKDRLSALRAKLIFLDRIDELVEPGSDASPQLSGMDENAAYVIFTSGSTGKPKAVVVSHKSAVKFLEAMLHKPGLKREDVIPAITSLSFDIAVLELIAPLCVGARIIIADAEAVTDGKALIDLLDAAGASVMQATPASYQLLIEFGWKGRPGLKILCGGEALSYDLARRLINCGGEVWNMYGPTETTIWSACRKIAGEEPVTIGKPIAGAQLYLLDHLRQLAPTGASAELHIGGDGVARGYFKHPDLTAEKFIPDPYGGRPGARLYRAGDLARRLADGDIEFLGRIDHQVKLRGFRIEPGEIEAALRSCPGVSQCVVLLNGSDAVNKKLLAYLVIEDGSLLRFEELKAALGQKLPEYMIPSDFIMLERLPLTLNGKVDRKALMAMERPRPAARGAKGPRSLTEDLLAEIWADTLRIEEIKVTDNFFDLGGHSLLAARVIARVRSVFQVDLSLRSVFETGSLEALARKIDDSVKTAKPLFDRIPRREALPLSFAQQRLWFMDQLAPENHFYNISRAIRLRGRLDAGVLEKTFSEIARRHETLRSVFIADDGHPTVFVSPEPTVALPIVDLGDLPESVRETEADRLSRGELRKPFDLERGPLLRSLLLRLSPLEHIALLTLHHIISDGWSMGILAHEIGVFYRAFTDGQPPPLSAIEIQYADYAAWQRRWLQSQAREEAVAYWKKQLADPPTALDLANRVRPLVQRYNGAKEMFALDSDLSASLKALGRRNNITMFMTLLAGFYALIQYLTDKEDLLVGTISANRNYREVEPLIGCFANLLPLRVDLSNDPSLADLFARVRSMTIEAFAHQEMPFELLIQELQPTRDPRYAPLVQVIFAFHTALAPSLELPGLTLIPLPVEMGTAKYDLVFDLQEVERGLLGGLEYNTDLFRVSDARRMIALYEQLLRFIVATPEKKLSALLQSLAEWEKARRRTVEETQKSEGYRRKLRISKRKLIVDLHNEFPFEIANLSPDKEIPAVLRPALKGVNQISWLAANRNAVEDLLLRRRALLFRGFGIASSEALRDFAAATSDGLLLDYRDRSSPREEISDRIYTSTDYPADQEIFQHNEGTYWIRWPLKIYFSCLIVPERGGATPIADGRKIFAHISPALRERFIKKKVMYVRNYNDGFGLTWQTVFQTDSRKMVEKYCLENQIEFEWKTGDRLRTRAVRPAVVKHPRTGEEVWFNHATFFHVSTLEPGIRDLLLSEFALEDLPYNTYYGDGAPIEPSVLDELRAAYRREQVSFPWEKGDVLMLDNMSITHGRESFVGSRKVIVAMADPYESMEDHGLR